MFAFRKTTVELVTNLPHFQTSIAFAYIYLFQYYSYKNSRYIYIYIYIYINEKLKFELDKFLELIPDDHRAPNNVTAARSNSILD